MGLLTVRTETTDQSGNTVINEVEVSFDESQDLDIQYEFIAEENGGPILRPKKPRG